MKIIPVAFDSMGVRSMCTYIQTDTVNILIDPGIALATRRLGLPPTNLELDTFYKFKEKIVNFARNADIIIITQYMYDHYISSHDEHFDDIYTDKIILCKNRKTKLNFEQRERGKLFEINAQRICKEFHFIDGKEFSFDGVKIKFSPPVWHGTERSENGYVVMVTVSEKGEKFFYSSDVIGPMLESTTEYIIKEDADTSFICGPPTHLIGYSFPEGTMEIVNRNVERIIKETKKTKTIVYDHYILRDKNYTKYFKPWAELAKKYNKRFITAAEFANQPIKALEANRDKLYENEPY